MEDFMKWMSDGMMYLAIIVVLVVIITLWYMGYWNQKEGASNGIPVTKLSPRASYKM